MKKILFLWAATFAMTACGESKTVTVTVENELPVNRQGELVEVSMDEVDKMLQLTPDGQVVVSDADGAEVSYQITHDGKLIFPVMVAANASATYTIRTGVPAEIPVIACGRQYPERVDDIAWENDIVAFRCYGPALQASGEKAYGYDVWTKYNTTEPVVEARYAMELNPETLAKIDSLRKTDPRAARALRAATSYHADHGNGLDCYKVGPTLGGGTSALMFNGAISYPYCYTEYEILDNGPLRFTVLLKYGEPVADGNTEGVPRYTEIRLVSLDAGSYLNKAVVSYNGLTESTPVVTGLVLHETEKEAVIATDAANGYITYVDPTDNPSGDNGKIFVGAVFPGVVNEAKAVYFDAKEAKERGAEGHVLAISTYEPDKPFTYYFGAAWSKAAVKDAESWNRYVAEYAQKVRNPLTAKLEVMN